MTGPRAFARCCVAVAAMVLSTGGAPRGDQRTTDPSYSLGPWERVADYPTGIIAPAVATDGVYLYSAGGYLGGSVDTAYRYDPVVNVWNALPTLPTALQDARGAYAPSTNSFYVFGGQAGNNGPTVATTYKFDIAANSWTAAALMPDARSLPGVAYCTATGKINVIGGFDSTYVARNQTWEYDPVADAWRSRANVPTAVGGGGTSATGQHLFVAGGNTGPRTHYRYDVATDTWTTLAPLLKDIYYPMAAVLGGREYIVGGEGITFPYIPYSPTLSYEIASDTWTQERYTRAPHYSAAGTAIGRRLIVLGGFYAGFIDPTVEVAGCLACTVFSDPVLRSGSTVVKAVHISEPRSRIDALRARFGLPPAVWTDEPLTARQLVIKARHLAEMRSALSQAYVAHGLMAPYFTDPTLTPGIVVKAVHMRELRDAIVTLENWP
jgi:N-acetylneuraminic acid mutarotase